MPRLYGCPTTDNWQLTTDKLRMQHSRFSCRCGDTAGLPSKGFLKERGRKNEIEECGQGTDEGGYSSSSSVLECLHAWRTIDLEFRPIGTPGFSRGSLG